MTPPGRYLWTPLAICLGASTILRSGELAMRDRIVITGTTGQTSIAFLGAPRCDPNGNVFVQPLVGGSVEANLIWGISADGRKVTHIAPRSVPGFEAARIGAISVSSDGQPYVLVAVPSKGDTGQQYVMAFDHRGKVKSKPVQLEGVWATGLAVFDSGRYLVSGSADTHGATLLIVGTDGKVLTTVKPPGDPARRPADAQDASESWSESGWSNLAELTFAEPTEDDHVIVVRPTLHGPAYEVSSAGEVVQTLTLMPPVHAAALNTVKVSHGRLAALYKLDSDSGHPQSVIAITDVPTEVKLYEYSNALGIFACYQTDGSADTFGFLRAETEGLVMALARER